MYELDMQSRESGPIKEMAVRYNLVVNCQSAYITNEWGGKPKEENPIIDLPQEVIERFVTDGNQVVEEYILNGFIDVTSTPWISSKGRVTALNGKVYMSRYEHARADERYVIDLQNTHTIMSDAINIGNLPINELFVLSGKPAYVAAYVDHVGMPVSLESVKGHHRAIVQIEYRTYNFSVPELKMAIVTEVIPPHYDTDSKL